MTVGDLVDVHSMEGEKCVASLSGEEERGYLMVRNLKRVDFTVGTTSSASYSTQGVCVCVYSLLLF